MRLDKYLKVSGLIPRRTVANEACDAGRVRVNGKSAKAADEVRVGQVVAFDLGRGRVEVEVLEVPQGNVSRERRSATYRHIGDADGPLEARDGLEGSP